MPQTYTPHLEIQRGPGGRGIIGLHLGSPAAVFLTDVYGLDAKGSAWLVGRILSLALHHAGLLDEPVMGVTGTLRDGVILAQVLEPVRATEIILAELNAVFLADFCQLGIRTTTGWYCVHPHAEIRLNHLLDTERHELTDARFVDKMHALIAAVKSQQPPPSDTPPSDTSSKDCPPGDTPPGDCPPPAAPK